MPICAVVLESRHQADELGFKLAESSTPIRKCQVIPPSKEILQTLPEKPLETNNIPTQRLETVEIDQIPFLNPKIARQRRQKVMAFWLMPFGFFAGLSFSKMTGLDTFSNLGLGPIGEPLIGSLLGASSGLLGSYVATASVNPPINEDLKVLRKRNEEGMWLMLLETPSEIELPWQCMQEVNPKEILRFSEQ